MNIEPSVPSTAITINNQPEVQSEAQVTGQTTALQKSGVKGVNGANSETGLTFNPLLPLKPTSSGLPPFPVDALPEVMGTYVRAVAEHSQTSVDMASVIGLGVMATCLQGKFQVEGHPGYTEPLNLYTMVIAPPGERKSSVMREMTQPLADYEREYNLAHADELRANRLKREALTRKIKALENILSHCADDGDEGEQQLIALQTELEQLPTLRPLRLSADDCTSEALTSLLAENDGCMSVISTEGGVFDILTGRYSKSVNIDTWLKAHCGDPIRVDRKGREAEYIQNPALTAILSAQPQVLEEIMENTTLTGRGLLARFLYASPPSRIGTRVFNTQPIPEKVQEGYRAFLFRLLTIPKYPEPLTLYLSPFARHVLEEHFLCHEAYLAGEGQEISGWASKYIGAVLRIAGLLHVAEAGESDEIPADTMQAAIAIGQYFLAQARYAFALMGLDDTVKRAVFLLSKLEQNRIPQIKRYDLFHMSRGRFFKKVEDIQAPLELLESYGYLRLLEPEKRSGPGRTADILVVLNPRLLAAS